MDGTQALQTQCNSRYLSYVCMSQSDMSNKKQTKNKWGRGGIQKNTPQSEKYNTYISVEH